MKSIIDVYSWRTKQLEVLGSINNLIELTIKGRNTGSFELTIADHVSEEAGSPPMLPSTLAMVVPKEVTPSPRSCNRHLDCDAADAKVKAEGGFYASHCHDDCCEDCFGY